MNREVYHRYETGEREIPGWAVIQLEKYYKRSTDYILSRAINDNLHIDDHTIYCE